MVLQVTTTSVHAGGGHQANPADFSAEEDVINPPIVKERDERKERRFDDEGDDRYFDRDDRFDDRGDDE